jgi:polyhydroxybutyrate depolymerase
MKEDRFFGLAPAHSLTAALAASVALLVTSLVGCTGTSGGGNQGTGGASGAAGHAATGAGGTTGAGGASGAAGHSGTGGASGAAGHSGTGGATTGGTGGATTNGTGGATTSGTGGATGVDAGAAAPSAGCGVTGSPTGTAQDMMLTVTGQTTVRTYRLSVPTSYSPTTPLPLLIGFHGVGGTGKQTQSSFNLESANTGGGKAIFAYPDALTKVEPDGTTAVDWDTTTTGVDFAFFDALVKELESKYCVDTHRIFATGISAGGIFTNFMGCWRGNVLRGIAPVASIKPWQLPKSSGTKNCNGEVASMVIHGTNDPYSDYTTNGLVTLAFWIQQDGCQATTPPPVTDPLTPNACVDYQGCDPGFPVVMCSHDEGHAWPVKTGFSCSSTSTVCFDANIAVWNFFSALP